MRKKLIVLLTAISLLSAYVPYGAVADEANDSVKYTFNNYESTADGTLPPSGFGMPGQMPYSGETASYAGAWSVDLGGGNKAVELKTNTVGNFGIGTSFSVGSFTGTVECSVSFSLNDYNIRRYFGLYDCNHYGNEFFTILEATGEVYFCGVRTNIYPSLNKWYKLTVTYDFAEKLAKGEISDDSGVLYTTFATRDIYSAGEYGTDNHLHSIYILHGKENAYFIGSLSNPASSYWDNLNVREVDSLTYPIDSSYDFDDFEGTGQSAPDGLTFYNGKAGLTELTPFEYNGEKVARISSTQIRKTGLTYKFPVNALGKAALMVDIIPTDTIHTRFLGINQTFGYLFFDAESGKIKIGSTELMDFEANKKYNCILIVDQAESKVSAIVRCDDIVKEGETEISEISSIPSLGVYVQSTTAGSETYIDNFTTFSVVKLNAQIVSSVDSEGLVKKGQPICIQFTTPVLSIPQISLDGEIISQDLITKSGTTKLLLDIDKLTEYDNKHRLTIENASDVMGRTLTKDIEFSTVKEYIFSDIKLVRDGGCAKAVASVAVNSNNAIDAVLVIASYAKDGEMKDIDICKHSVCSQIQEFSVSADFEDGDYVEAFFADSVVNRNFYAPSVSMGTALNLFSKTSDTSPVIKANNATGIVMVGGIGIGENDCGFIVLKPGKTLADLDGDNAAENIAYIKIFSGSYGGNAYSFPVRNTSGELSVVYKSADGDEFINNAIKLFSEEKINEVKELINQTNPDWNAIYTQENAEVLSVDLNAYNSLSPNFKNMVNSAILSEREKLANSRFENISGFYTVFTKAMIAPYINSLEDGEDVKAAFNKYNEFFELENADGYNVFMKLTVAQQYTVFTNIAQKSDYEALEDIIEQFSNEAVVVFVNNIKNSVDFKKLIDDNKLWLGFDLTYYDSLLNKSIVNDKMVSVKYTGIEEMRDKFLTESYNVYLAQQSTDSSSSSVSGGGSSSSVSSGGGSSSKNINFNVVPVQIPGDNVSDAVKPHSRFADLAGVEWAREAVEDLYLRNIVSGKSDTIFAPNDNITREEFVKLLVCAFAENEEAARSDFKDTVAGAWYESYIATAYNLGIVKGREDGTFGIGESITRQDLTVLAARAAKIAEDDLNPDFSDASAISGYAKGYVASLAKSGVIKGRDTNNFEPYGFATRAEASVIIYRLLSVKEAE